jgi:hypothetical protein
MISVSKESDDKVIAYIEWRQVGQSGFDKFRGEFIYIAELWIHEEYHNQWHVYRELMNDIFRKAPQAKFVYFQRRKYDGKQSKNYTREQIMKLVQRVPQMFLREVA